MIGKFVKVNFVHRLVWPLLFTMCCLCAQKAVGEVRIDITRGNIKPLPIAITDMFSEKPSLAQLGRNISKVISADLERSGLFKPIDPRVFLQDPKSLTIRPRYSDWRVINAQALVTGKVKVNDKGEVIVEARVWDVYSEEHMAGKAYTTDRTNWRRVAHIIADMIYQRITGESGYFDTRIVYIAESGPKQRRIKRLAIMDQDGANHKFLTEGKDLVLTPRFSPIENEITYLSYFNNTPRAYLFNMDTRRRELIGQFEGMTFAPRFSPDGKSVILSFAQDGNSDIWTMNLQTRKKKRLTTNPSIDTSASYDPTGRRIVFNSDRGGTQQLYVMDVNGGRARRISFGKGRYATPVWSPRGDLIAFTRQSEGKFFIGVMRPDGSGERLLSKSFLEEAPTWAPNGRVIMFYREARTDRKGRGGETRVWSIDLTGYNLREVMTPGDASDPAWSPIDIVNMSR